MSKEPHTAPRRRWIEGLDWIRVENILDPDFGGSPEQYTAVLKTVLYGLMDADPDLRETIVTEAMQRARAGEMSREQGTCFAEALQFSAEECGRMAEAMQKILKRGQLRVVK